MVVLFYVSAVITVLATIVALTRVHAVHALLYLVLALLGLAVVFYSLGAPYVAALQAIVYAGAIMVLFLFVVMLLGSSRDPLAEERSRTSGAWWGGASVLSLVLLGELGYVLSQAGSALGSPPSATGPKAVALELFGPYLLGVELASFLLLSGLIGALHVGRQHRTAVTRTDPERGRRLQAGREDAK